MSWFSARALRNPAPRRPRGWREKLVALGYPLSETKKWPAERVVDTIERQLLATEGPAPTPEASDIEPSLLDAALAAEAAGGHEIKKLSRAARQKRAGKLTPIEAAELLNTARDQVEQSLRKVRAGLRGLMVLGRTDEEKTADRIRLQQAMAELRASNAQQEFRERQFEAVNEGQGITADEMPKKTPEIWEKSRERSVEDIHRLGQAARTVYGEVFGGKEDAERALTPKQRRAAMADGLPNLVTASGSAISLEDSPASGLSWEGGELRIEDPKPISIRKMNAIRRHKDTHTTQTPSLRAFKGSRAPLMGFAVPMEVLLAPGHPSTILVKAPAGGGGRVLMYRKRGEVPRGGFLLHGMDGQTDPVGTKALEMAINSELLFVASKGPKWARRKDPSLYLWVVGTRYLQRLREPGDEPVWPQIQAQFARTREHLKEIQELGARADGERVVDWTRPISPNSIPGVLRGQIDMWLKAERDYKTRTRRDRAVAVEEDVELLDADLPPLPDSEQDVEGSLLAAASAMVDFGDL